MAFRVDDIIVSEKNVYLLNDGVQYIVDIEPFESKNKAIEEGLDIKTQTILKENVISRKRVADTDIGKKSQEEIDDLKQLLVAYREGILKEKI